MIPPDLRNGRLVLEEYQPETFQLLPDLDPKSTWWPGTYQKPRCWYHEKLVGSNTLLLCLGDSWTWGDCLSPNDENDQYRIDNIYGTHISTELGCDFLQLARTASSNYEIYKNLKFALPRLINQYDQIYVIVTLTENGRELNTNNIWASQLDFNDVDTLSDFLEKYEKIMFKSFNNLFVDYSNIQVLFGRNFTYSFENNISVMDCKHLSLTWTDLLAEYQNLLDYPKNLRLLSQIAMGPMIEYLNLQKLKFNLKSDLIPYMDAGFSAYRWLDNSNLNNKETTKHPKELGHKLWADYLLKNIK